MADEKVAGPKKPDSPAEPARCSCGGKILRTRCNDGSGKNSLRCAECGAHTGFAPANGDESPYLVKTNF